MKNLSKRAVALLLLSSILLTTGCGGKGEPINGLEQMSNKQISQLSLLSDEELMVKSNVTGTEEELKGLIYQHVTGNLTVDSSNLLSTDSQETEMIMSKIKDVNAALRGQDNNSIDDSLLNYMLWEFAKTQKEWEQDEDGVKILGIDPSSRKVFVDVSYHITGNDKTSIPQSNIIEGDPLADSMKKARYDEYLKYLAADYSANTANTSVSSVFGSSNTDTKQANLVSKAQELLEAFENHWGKVQLILDEQQGTTLAQRLRRGISNLDTGLTLSIEPDFWVSHADVPAKNREDVISADVLAGRVSASGSKITTAPVEGTTEEGEEAKPASSKSALNIKTPLTDTEMRYVSARGIGTYTYSGIAKQNFTTNEATMTFRLILDFKFNLGSQTSLGVSSVYLKDYMVYGNENTLQNLKGGANNAAKYDAVNGLELITQNSSVIKPYIDRCIDSYQKCIEENNIEGLYKLYGSTKTVDEYSGRVLSTTSRFKDWDKYYYDWSNYAYTKFDAYEYEIISWVDNKVQALVTRNKKIRAKGSEMTMPSYSEEALITFIVEDDSIYIDNEVVLSTHMVGEPVSMIKDVTGIASKIAYDEKSFSVENEAAVVEALKAFSKLQLTYANAPTTSVSGTVSEAGYVDLGVGVDTLNAIKDTMGAIAAPTEKITWLGTWSTKSNVYCKVHVREVFFLSDGKTKDTEADIGLISRNGVWSVVSYDRSLVANSALTKENTPDKGCLSHDYTSAPSTSDYEVNTDTTAAGLAGAQGTTSGASSTTVSASGTESSEPAVVPDNTSSAVESSLPADTSSNVGEDDIPLGDSEPAVTPDVTPDDAQGTTAPVDDGNITLDDTSTVAPPDAVGGDDTSAVDNSPFGDINVGEDEIPLD